MTLIQAAQQTAQANPNLTYAVDKLEQYAVKAGSFLDAMGAKLGAAGITLYKQYAKFVMAEALAWMVACCIFAGVFFIIAHKCFKESRDPNNSKNDQGGAFFFGIFALIIGTVILGSGVASNLGTIIAPEGAVIQKVLNHAGNSNSYNYPR